MKTVAIVLVVIGVFAVVVLSIGFFIELARNQEEKEPEIKPEQEKEPEQNEEKTEEQTNEEFDLNAMLAKLEASIAENAKETEQEEVPAEEPAQEAQEEEAKEEATTETPAEEEKEEPVSEEAKEEPAEEAKETASPKVIVVREKTTEVIEHNAEEPVVVNEETSAEVVDLSTRLESVRESQAKVEADLTKANREINKYERTERRMARNQKLLDKKAEDLTKLNLVLYSVTDIKNIDSEKKQKQEELVTHINELKTSIKDAQTYLDQNREKYENSQKMKTFFEGEKERLDADEKEILTLMGQDTDADAQ